MLTPIVSAELLKPVSARVVADAHPLPDLSFGSPAGVSGRTDRGALGIAATVESPWRTWQNRAEALTDRSLADDRVAHAAFQRGMTPEDFASSSTMTGRELRMRDLLIDAERRGEVVKLTGPRSVSTPGGDAA